MINNKEDSVKYYTKPTASADYTGCHPVIAEHLKRSEEIKCWAWDQDCHEKPNSCREAWIVRYLRASNYPYRANVGTFFRHAEPIPRKVRRIMPPELAIPVLIAGGWSFDAHGALIGDPYSIVPQMFAKMGLPLEDNSWKWPDCIIEECDK